MQSSRQSYVPPMPTDFLTSEQRARYNTFVDEPSLEEISRYFYLDERDRTLIRTYHGEANQLGFAVQRIALRYLGTFLEDIQGIPSGILHIIADQLCLHDPVAALQQYANASVYCSGFLGIVA